MAALSGVSAVSSSLFGGLFANKVLTGAFAVSIGLHAAVLAVRFVDPEFLRVRSSDPPLEIILVNSRSESKPTKAEALAQANLDRALQLVERGFVTKANVDQLTATRDAAVARVKVAEAQLRELRARNERLNIYAPEAGYVLQRNVEPGQTVGAGSGALFTIARGGELELLAQLSEDQLAKLPVGTTATVIPTGTEKRFRGEIWQLAPIIDQASRQGTARIALNWAPELRPGGFATARISSGTVTATILPESAVLADGDGSFVYVIGEDNKAERRAIKTGMVTKAGVVVIEGLTGSERVVLRAGGFLTPGESVNPQPLKS